MKFLFQIGSIKSDDAYVHGDEVELRFYSKLVRLKGKFKFSTQRKMGSFYSKLVRLKAYTIHGVRQ